jgi:hypothetical protein
MVILVSLRTGIRQTQKAKVLRKKLCSTKATKERVGQQLRTQSFILLVLLAALLTCGVLRAASIFKIRGPYFNLKYEETPP